MAHVTGRPAELLRQTLAAQRISHPMQAAVDYVETFDLRRRMTMYLTYWTAGDTRNRGSEMHAFVEAYRDSGVEPPEDEAPDHLPVELEFAAIIDPETGRRLLTDHRVPIDVLREALRHVHPSSTSPGYCGSPARCPSASSWLSSATSSGS